MRVTFVYSCDFVIPQYHIVVEVDGDYWHSLPKRKQLDKIKDDLIEYKNLNHKLRGLKDLINCCEWKIKKGILQ